MLGQIGWHECQVDRENDEVHKLFQLNPVHDHELILRCSPLARACHATFRYIDQHGHIGLTKSKAFNRKFIHWAAEAFNWPGQTHDDLFYLNKVLNEYDFPACELLHQLLLLQKLGRHYKGQFRLTANGKKMAGDPSTIFETLVSFYLFQIVHEHGRFDIESPFGNWDVFLNVLNVEL